MFLINLGLGLLSSLWSEAAAAYAWTPPAEKKY